jgi:two-component system, sporulation sensor kinase E
VKSGFLDKLVERLDRIDPKSLQTQFLRLAQEQGLLETIFQSIQEGVLVIDEEGLLTYANHAAESLLGFSLDVSMGRPVSRYLREIDWARILKLDEKEWSKLVSSEVEITYPEHRYVSFYIVPLDPGEEGDGEKRGAVVILRDVTRDREEESSVLESERLNAVKLLAAGVAHEIGNPLNALNIHLQLLDRELKEGLKVDGSELSDDEKKDTLSSLTGLVQVARKEVSRLDLIITQFLRAIRPAKPDLVLLQVDALLKESITLLEQEVKNRQIHIELDLSNTIPKVHVDAAQMKQAFFNVIRNAFQAMPDSGSLTISRKCTDEFLAISFEDSGEGIRSEDLGRIFESYYSTKESGSGLGLMIVQRIVQDHGGQMEVESKEGEGAKFTILLPLSQRRIRLLPKSMDARKADRAD